MAAPNGRIAGRLVFKIDNVQHYARSEGWSYNIGAPVREDIVGADEPHGYSERPQMPKLEGSISDRSDFDLRKFLELTNCTATLELANGKTIVWRNAWQSGDGKVDALTGSISCAFSALSADEIQT